MLSVILNINRIDNFPVSIWMIRKPAREIVKDFEPDGCQTWTGVIRRRQHERRIDVHVVPQKFSSPICVNSKIN